MPNDSCRISTREFCNHSSYTSRASVMVCIWCPITSTKEPTTHLCQSNMSSYGVVNSSPSSGPGACMLRLYASLLGRRLIGLSGVIGRTGISQRALPFAKVVFMALAGSLRFIVDATVLPSIRVSGTNRAAQIALQTAANLINLAFRIGVSRSMYLWNIAEGNPFPDLHLHIAHQK